MKITDTLIAAYVDNELPAADRAAVEAAAKLDPDVAERLERHQRLRRRMAGAFAATFDEAVPEALVATIVGAKTGPDNVVDLAKAREQRAAPPPRARGSWLAWGAIAAGIALVIVVAQGRIAPPTGPMIAYGPQGLTAKGALAGALDKQLVASQSATGQPVRILVSFRSTDGRYCRSFQIERDPGLAGVACREADGWSVQTAAVSAPEPATQYRTAGSTTPTAVLDSVSAMIAGSPLDAVGESAALAKGWRP
jgi:hypothetical protein